MTHSEIHLVEVEDGSKYCECVCGQCLGPTGEHCICPDGCQCGEH